MSFIALIIAILVPTAICVFSIRHPPSWLNKGSLAPFWSKINFISLSAAALTAILSFILFSSHLSEYRCVAVVSSAILTFVLGQTLFTDFSQRLADRRVFWIASAISGLIGFWFLNQYDKQSVALYLIFALVATALIFVPSIGDSDGRAAQLVILSAFPVIGINGIQLGIIGFFISVLLYSLFTAIKNKNFKLAFLSQLSIPAVPLVIAPFLLVTIASAFFPIR